MSASFKLFGSASARFHLCSSAQILQVYCWSHGHDLFDMISQPNRKSDDGQSRIGKASRGKN